MSDQKQAPAFEGWAILELMGHKRLAGYVRQADMFGEAFCRIDIPAAPECTDEILATQFYGGSSIYCLTPCTEETARKVALMARPAPVQPWELPAALPAPAHNMTGIDDDEEEEFDHDDLPY